MGHAQFHKGRMKGDESEIDIAQALKCLDGRLVLLEKVRKTFSDSIPNKYTFSINGLVLEIFEKFLDTKFLTMDSDSALQV